MARIEGEIVIERPVGEVFDFVADERNEPRYNPRMLSAELVSGEPIGSGSRFRAELKTPGRTMPMIVELTDFDRPRRLASTTRSSMMETTGALTFEPKAHGTVMRWSWDVRPRGLMRVMPAAVGLIGRRQEQRIWENLKRLLESRAPESAFRGIAGSLTAVGRRRTERCHERRRRPWAWPGRKRRRHGGHEPRLGSMASAISPPARARPLICHDRIGRDRQAAQRPG